MNATFDPSRPARDPHDPQPVPPDQPQKSPVENPPDEVPALDPPFKGDPSPQEPPRL